MSIVWLAFITGLTTGGISCLAVQGGLLTSAVSSRKGIMVFLIAKIVAYTALGFLLGMVGSTLLFAPKVLGYVQIAAGLFMAATALRLIDAHPIFRHFVITPPRWSYRLLKTTSKNESIAAPLLLGLCTIFMPCGVTQATMAVAVSTGSPLLGALVMGAFVLGTGPIFLALGAAIVGLMQKKVFAYVASAIVGVFALLSINGGIALTGSPYTLQNYWKAATNQMSVSTAAPLVDGVQTVTIDVESQGYVASSSRLRVGVPVRLTIRTHGVLGCGRAFTIPALGISKVLPLTGEDTILFTPQKKGTLVYSCSMGMYTGQFTIVN